MGKEADDEIVDYSGADVCACFGRFRIRLLEQKKMVRETGKV